MSLRLRAAAATAAMAAWLPAQANQPADLDLSAYRGKVVYLDFWASWCAPCQESFQWMADMQSSYGHRGLVVIAVNVDHDHSAAERFLSSHFANFKIIYDPKGQIASKYKVSGMPMAFLIAKDGHVASSHNGFFENKEDAYASQIAQLLSQPER